MVFKTHVNGSQIVVDETPSLPEGETIEMTSCLLVAVTCLTKKNERRCIPRWTKRKRILNLGDTLAKRKCGLVFERTPESYGHKVNAGSTGVLNYWD